MIIIRVLTHHHFLNLEEVITQALERSWDYVVGILSCLSQALERSLDYMVGILFRLEECYLIGVRKIFGLRGSGTPPPLCVHHHISFNIILSSIINYGNAFVMLLLSTLTCFPSSFVLIYRKTFFDDDMKQRINIDYGHVSSFPIFFTILRVLFGSLPDTRKHNNQPVVSLPSSLYYLFYYVQYVLLKVEEEIIIFSLCDDDPQQLLLVVILIRPLNRKKQQYKCTHTHSHTVVKRMTSV